VNGVNVERDFHAECAAKIHSVVGQVKLLVVDSEADAYFQQRRMPLSSSQPYVSKHACPIKNPPGPASCQIFFIPLCIIGSLFQCVYLQYLTPACLDVADKVHPVKILSEYTVFSWRPMMDHRL